MRKQDSYLAAVALVGTVGVVMFITWRHAFESYLGDELFKLTYQFLLLVVVGGAVSIGYQSGAAARDQREKHRMLQRHIHQDLLSGYMAAKQARRLLRARALRYESHFWWIIRIYVRFDEYDRQLQAVSEAQLKLESAIRQIEVNRTLFKKSAGVILSQLTNVDKYMGSLIREWERAARKLSAAPRELPLRMLPALSTFVARFERNEPFHLNFKRPFRNALRLFERAIAEGP